MQAFRSISFDCYLCIAIYKPCPSKTWVPSQDMNIMYRIYKNNVKYQSQEAIKGGGLHISFAQKVLSNNVVFTFFCTVIIFWNFLCIVYMNSPSYIRSWSIFLLTSAQSASQNRPWGCTPLGGVRRKRHQLRSLYFRWPVLHQRRCCAGKGTGSCLPMGTQN